MVTTLFRTSADPWSLTFTHTLCVEERSLVSHTMPEPQDQGQLFTYTTSTNDNVSSAIHRAKGFQNTTMSTKPDNSTMEDATPDPGQGRIPPTASSACNNSNTKAANQADAKQAELDDMAERAISYLRRAMAEYREKSGPTDFLLPSARKKKMSGLQGARRASV